MNMFQPTTAQSVKEYLEQVPAERQATIKQLHALIQETVPTLQAHFASNMIGYGSFVYKNYKKEIVNWPIIALANQKNYISIYVCALEDGQYLAEKYREQLGKVNVGKSCIRFKRLEDINLSTLQTILRKAAKQPGLGQKL